MYLLWETDKRGNVDELVTLVLTHKTLWQVLREMPDILQLTARLGTRDMQGGCQ